WDGVVLIVLYSAYLIVLSKLPPEEIEEIEELERVPRAIDSAARPPNRRYYDVVHHGRSSDLLLRRAVPGKPSVFGGRRRSPDVCVRPMDGSRGFRVPGNGVDILLGAHS